MASNVIIRLGLDKENLDGKFLYVIERHGSHAGFVLSSLIVLGFQSDASIYLVSLHQQEKHYEKICARLGINLELERQKGRFIGWYPVVDGRNIEGSGETQNDVKSNLEQILKNMFFHMKNDVATLKGKNSRVFIIIDDISDLLLAGCELKSVLLLAQSCRTLLGEGTTLVIGSHVSKEDKHQLILFETFRRLSDISIEVNAFEAVRTFNGTLRIIRKRINSGLVKHLSDLHHYKITDNRIVLYSPGFNF